MSIATLEITGLKIGIAAAVLAGCCGSTWFAASSHYSKALSSLEGQLQGAAMAQKAVVATQIKMDQEAAKEVDSETQQQIGSMASVLGDLSVRLASANGRVITLRPAPASAPIACVKPDRPATAASDRSVPEPQKPVAAEPEAAATIPADILDGVITVGIDALKAELLWREYVRKTGQTK